MMIRIIPMKKVLYSNEPDDYGYTTNVIGKSDFCCKMLEEFILRRSSWEPLAYSNDWVYLYSVQCYFCPFCGTKINTEEIETETRDEYERDRENKEKKWVAYMKGLPPTPKKVVRKNKKKALADYNKVFERVLKK